MSRGWKIALIVAGGLVTVVVAFLLVLWWTAPPPLPIARTEPKDLPTAWRPSEADVEPAPASSLGEPQTPVSGDDMPQVEPPPPEPAPFLFDTEGTLVAEADGKVFATESYRLRYTEDGMSLRSTGQFSFKVVLATLRMNFEQELSGTTDSSPLSYRFELDAPLGQSQSIEARLIDNRMQGSSNDEPLDVSVDADRVLIVGTFSTYALLPARLIERGIAEETYDVFFFGGRPGNEPTEETDLLPQISILRDGTATLRVEGDAVLVDRYRIGGSTGGSILLALGPEFLALVSGEDESGFRVYRSDYFPNGFDLSSTEAD